MQGSDVVTVFLVDDHELVRRGLRQLLETEPGIEVVGEAAAAQEAIARIRELEPRVALLDARLGDGSGIHVCREVRSTHPHVAALILTSFDDEQAVFESILAGAAGYLLKQVRSTDLVDAVRRVAEGQSLLDPAVTGQVLERVRRGPEGNPALEILTPQEQRILELVGEGMTNRQIAEQVFLAEKTVRNYVSSILAKLGLERRTQAAVFSVRHKD
ncbi:MAG: response regulator transcription factor [Nocardioidaceae bacterium]